MSPPVHLVTAAPHRPPAKARPALRVVHPWHVPNGPYRALALPNAALSADLVPAGSAPWEAVQEFALSYDGYRYWSDVAELARRAFELWARERVLPVDLDEMRGCLFYEQRRCHHAGREPLGRHALYVEALLRAIGELVDAGLCAGDPDIGARAAAG